MIVFEPQIKRSRGVSPGRVALGGPNGPPSAVGDDDEEESSDEDTVARIDSPPPAPQASAEDDDMGFGHEGDSEDRDANGDSDDGAESDEETEENRLPDAFPANPPAPDLTPDMEFISDKPRTSSSDRNRHWTRRLRDSFVAYQAGMRGDPYRRRCNFEHMTVMG